MERAETDRRVYDGGGGGNPHAANFLTLMSHYGAGSRGRGSSLGMDGLSTP